MYICIGNDEYIDAESILMILNYEQLCTAMPELKLRKDELPARDKEKGGYKSVIITDGGNIGNERMILSTVSVRTLTARAARYSTD